MFNVSVGGVVFEARPSNYDHAFVIEPEGLTGWFDSVTVRGDTKQRPAQHGDFDLPVFRGPRIITVSGNALARSEYDLEHAGAIFTGILADGESLPLTVEGAGNASFATVKLSGTPKFSPHPSGLEASFQISFKAVDPRKYGKPNSFSGSTVQAHHYGNFPASPVIEVVGPRTAPYSVTGPGGRKVTCANSVPSGKTDVIDFARGGVFRDGVRQLGGVTWWEPWTIPPGKQVSMSISSGSMKVTVPDTYM